ncbi:four helix bundle protein [Lacihabitans sp. CCS-44]|nr:four helix bundle protein [Lacihabitans sp. CCS-44]
MLSYRDLLIWQKSMDLVTDIYRASARFPKEEVYGLTSQIRRSSISVPSNIAEGYGRRSTGDYKRFLSISLGSLYEFQTQLEVSKRLNYLEESEFEPLNNLSKEIEKMTNSLISKL